MFKIHWYVIIQPYMENTTQPPTKIVKTWFLERGDGTIFACNELEAWNTLSNHNSWKRNDFKIVGVSSGKVYVDTLKSATLEKQKNDLLVKEKSVELTRYLNTLDKFKFELLLDDKDEKVVKVKEIIKGIEKEIEELGQEFSKGYKAIVDKAFQAELAVARGNIEQPTNQNIMTPKGDRDRIIKSMRV